MEKPSVKVGRLGVTSCFRIIIDFFSNLPISKGNQVKIPEPEIMLMILILKG